MKLIFMALAAALSLSNVVAAEESNKVGSFTCYAKDDFMDVSVGKEVRANNFAITERKAMMSTKMSVVEIAFSVANRTGATAYPAGQFILVDQTGPIASLDAAPMMDLVSAGGTETAKGNIYVEPGLLDRASGICMLLTGLK